MKWRTVRSMHESKTVLRQGLVLLREGWTMQCCCTSSTGLCIQASQLDVHARMQLPSLLLYVHKF